MRILAVDPGLTRCGVGIVDFLTGRHVEFVDVCVLQTGPRVELSTRLATLRDGILDLFARHAPDIIAIERVFSQHNVRTVMGTAQVSGVVLAEAGARGLPVTMHTPSEVKAAVTGSGRATKDQVALAVRHILKTPTDGLLPDATDALALAVCAAWRFVPGAQEQSLTPAQRKWRSAESRARGDHTAT